MRRYIQDWMVRAKRSIRHIMFPFIVIYFVRTLLVPTFFDVLVLFILFLVYLGAILDWY